VPYFNRIPTLFSSGAESFLKQKKSLKKSVCQIARQKCKSHPFSGKTQPLIRSAEGKAKKRHQGGPRPPAQKQGKEELGEAG